MTVDQYLTEITLDLGITMETFRALVESATLHPHTTGPSYTSMSNYNTTGRTYYDDPLNSHHAQFAVNNRPRLVLVETTVFSPAATPMTTKIVDSPPLPPDVDIVPYRSVKNKVLLMLNGSVGSYVDKPIIIEPTDVAAYSDQIISQDSAMTPDIVASADIEKDFQIAFDTDDYPQLFEIYRIDFAPRTYRDFSSGRKTVLNNTTGGQVTMTANSIIDTVVPNKKYWYTFRVVDVHNNKSNPSSILQFEMVDTGNSIYPLIEEYSFPGKEVSYTKSMRKYLMIAAATKQERKHRKATDPKSFAEHPNFGTRVAHSMWGERYKLRITSKLTGKRVDVNFTFKQGTLQGEEEL